MATQRVDLWILRWKDNKNEHMTMNLVLKKLHNNQMEIQMRLDKGYHHDCEGKTDDNTHNETLHH